MCLPPPRGVAWEEVANRCVSNFLLREGLIMHGEMSLQHLILNCAHTFFNIRPVRTIPLWKLRDQPLRNCSATGESKHPPLLIACLRNYMIQTVRTIEVSSSLSL